MIIKMPQIIKVLPLPCLLRAWLKPCVKSAWEKGRPNPSPMRAVFSLQSVLNGEQRGDIMSGMPLGAKNETTPGT